MEALVQDLRYGVRALLKTPGFTVVAILILALGIGANTAIFSLINALMLRSLAVKNPGELVELLHSFPGEPRFNGFSRDAYQLMRDQNHAFSGLIAATHQPFQLRVSGLEAHPVDGGYVNGTFFEVLGLQPALGRLLGPERDWGPHGAGRHAK